METIINYILTHIVPGVVISVVAAFVTVRLSLRRFRAERWWDRKAVAYSTIMESLHHMKEYCRKEIRAYENLTRLGEEQRESLVAKWREAANRISMATDVGSFIISEEAARCLKELESGLLAASQEMDWYAHLDLEYAGIEKCMKSLLVLDSWVDGNCGCFH
jgi:hypothetical protein